jgi:hypothetical protein
MILLVWWLFLKVFGGFHEYFCYVATLFSITRRFSPTILLMLQPDIPSVIFLNRTSVRVVVVESFLIHFIDFVVVLLHCSPVAILQLVVVALYPIVTANVLEPFMLYPNEVIPSADCGLCPTLVE